ncbi:MAG: exodeoxyribonuclease VII small subunit [Porcipelethomonas sp.]
MKFEDNMKNLSEIVEQLEKGEIPLETAVELYSKGVNIAADCRKELENARLKITEEK